MYQKPLQKSQFAECSILCCLGLLIFLVVRVGFEPPFKRTNEYCYL